MLPPKIKVILPAAAGGLLLPRPPARRVDAHQLDELLPPPAVPPPEPAPPPPASGRPRRGAR